MKVIHLPSTVGGNPQGISRHFNEIGVSSESWALCQNYLGYPADKVIYNEDDSLLWREIKHFWALSYIFRCDIVFFNFGQTLFSPRAVIPNPDSSIFKKNMLRIYSPYAALMQRLELLLLRILKRPMFIQYQGDDARQGDYSLKHFSITIATRVEPTYYTPKSDALKRRQIALLEKHCSKIYALNPDLLHVLPKRAEFLPYSHISLNEWLPNYTQMEDRPLRIGHAPSHRRVKGTDLFLAAAQRLKDKGRNFEIVLVEGLSNQEAKERYQSIDVLVDQLFAGWYGGLAVECMALGKPVIVYIRESDLQFIPDQMRQDLPLIKTTPDSVEEAIEFVLAMPREELLNLAKRSRAYVERYHDPTVIAHRIKKDMEGASRDKKY